MRMYVSCNSKKEITKKKTEKFPNDDHLDYKLYRIFCFYWK